jgi:hypothetical protein
MDLMDGIEVMDTAGIYHITNAALKQFHFEWHPESKRVYVVRLGGEKQVGDPIAHDVENHGQAVNYVLVWCRGYRERARELEIAR